MTIASKYTNSKVLMSHILYLYNIILCIIFIYLPYIYPINKELVSHCS